MIAKMYAALARLEDEHDLLVDVLDCARLVFKTDGAPVDGITVADALASLADAVDRYDAVFGESEPSPCDDCQTDTTPWADGEPTGPWEWYMVRREVWIEATGETVRFLCIRCLEDRLGRQLNADDFPALPVNEPSDMDSERLRDRLTRKPEAAR